jgi:prepilin peptidase CpaA
MTPVALLAAVFPALVIVAAVKDATSFTIPNWISLALAAAFAPAALFGGIDLPTFGLHLAVGVGALVAGMVMFALRWIGGGDAKLFAAAGLWIGVEAFGPFLLGTALAGGLLALFLVALRAGPARAYLPVGPGWIERLRAPDGPAPYGVAIAAGALVAFPYTALGGALAGG